MSLLIPWASLPPAPTSNDVDKVTNERTNNVSDAWRWNDSAEPQTNADFPEMTTQTLIRPYIKLYQKIEYNLSFFNYIS